ncbi:hypothetical protein GQ600_2410 [Phytophthora cactorum]|nr:hypothetical protein GQ600_2410 [Phytophthora cactorum]
MLLRTLVSALRRPLHPSTRPFHACTALQVPAASPAVAFESKSVPSSVNNSQVLKLLEHSIAQRLPTQALSHLAQLQTPPGAPLLQRLAVLLARQKKSRGHALRAFEILRGVYRTPGLKPDDYTKLASIYVMDACLRFRLLDHAMERVEEATEVLREVVNGEDVCPMEQTFLPVLVELVKSREYDGATELMRQGQAREVDFTSETFHPLLMLAEKDTSSTDSLIKFLSFVEDAWEEYKEFDPEDDSLDDPENPFRSL